MWEDKHLVARLKNGDKGALRRIYAKYKDDILSVATVMLQEANEAEDILHDVFVSFARLGG